MVTFNVINECYRDGSLTSSLRTGIIRLLRKGQKDPKLTGNYRPISLLSILIAHNRFLLSIFVLGEIRVVLIVNVNNKAIICIVFVFPCVGNKCLIVVYSNTVYEIYFMDFFTIIN